MIDLKTAYEIVCGENNGMKPVSCVELEKYYSFNMMPAIANSSVYLVDKHTGEYKVVYFMLVVNEPILRRYEESDFNFK